MENSHHISGIARPQENCTYLSQNGETEKCLKDLSKLNIFIGENNSGKSRLIRELASSDLSYYPQEYSLDLLNECIEKIKMEISVFAKRYNINIGEVKKALNNFQKVESLNSATNIFESYGFLMKTIKDMIKSKGTYSNINANRAGEPFKEIVENNFQQFDTDYLTIIRPISFKKFYIPILRGLRPIATNGEGFEYTDVYKNRTIEDYFRGVPTNFEIFTGLNTYNLVKEHLLGNLNQRKLVREYEDYLSEFFEGKPVTLIPSEKEGVLVIKIGDEIERPIYELGDGIQSLIIITMPLFLHRDEDVLLFLEEPELFLHPGLQRKLLETIMQQEGFERFQYFITTHSNHFLDLTLDFPDISIYSVKKKLDESPGEEKKPDFIIETLSHGDRSALDQLGVRNSSVYLSNCTIWVEGITDRMYLKRYLEVFYEIFSDKTRYKEDFHYSFVEYSGSNITHWSFLDTGEDPIDVERLCGRLFLIADRDDGTSPAKTERHEKLQQFLGDRFYLSECKEIENLISPPVLIRVLKDYGEDNEHLQKIALEITQEDYKNINIGEYIEKTILGEHKQRKGTYISGNTISDKVGFCRKTISQIKSWDDLSPEEQQLTERIYQFIQTNQK